MAEKPSLTSEENRILDLISNLEQDQGTYERGVFLHQDIHPWNLFVDAKSGTLSAIIDWGDAAFGDPAGEFASMPMCAVPAMLEGYRDTGGVVDGRLKQRALSLGLALSLWEIRELDEARFARQWWRHPRGGFAETEKWIDQILAGA
jgi:aminoglycoside phosphotransferase (APT) family kinase protein